MSARELFRCVRLSFEQDLVVTAGKNAGERPVLRLTVIGDRLSVERVYKYDAVIFLAASRKTCSILDAAEALHAKGICAMVISSEEYGVYELEQLRALCDTLSMPLVEVRLTKYLPALIHLIYDKMTGYFVDSLGIAELLQGVIRMPELYGYYGDILAEHGFYEYADYCVAVCYFVLRDGACGCWKDVAYASRFIETGLNLNGSASAILSLGYHIAVVFADIDTESAVSALKRGLAAIPDDLSAGYRIYIGVSDRARGIKSVLPLFGFAAKTALLQAHRENDGCPVRCSEQNLNKFMVSLKDRDTINSLVNDTLFRLAEYDRQNDTDYIHFLKVYFRNNCSLQKTAKELFIHRNSVNYALRKIESIIGRSLSDINTKAELVLGLGFLELSGDEPFPR